MDIEIVDMKEEHLDDILLVEEKCFTSPWPRSSFSFEINMNPMSRYFVAKFDGELVGYAGFWTVIDEGHITNICVDPRYRGKNIGGCLLEKLLKVSQDLGMSSMTLEVRRSNEVAKKLYEKYGFYSVGVRPNYYRKEKEDAIIMWNEFKDR